MLFSSIIFLFVFLPLVLLLYFVVAKKNRNLILLIFSLLFYSWGEKMIVLVMLSSTVIDYFSALIIEKRNKKLGLTISIAANLLFLTYFKYTNFAFENFHALAELININNADILKIPKIALPIGISFYTFQTMSYTIDVYRGKVKANKNFINFATYVTMFPQLIAGPIVRYLDIHKQLEKREISINKFAIGVQRFIIGLAKKVIIANTFSIIVDEVFLIHPEYLSPELAWIGIIAFFLQIYFDFSAYSDMAIGLGKMFGFDLLENFNYPYISKSVREFWTRWHISLTTWFRDYLMHPITKKGQSRFRMHLNIIIVFLVVGIWHGANWTFVVFGLIHGITLVIERLWLKNILKKIWAPIAHIYTISIVLFSCILFRAYDIGHAGNYVLSMFGLNQSEVYNFPASKFYTYETLIITIIAILFSTPIYFKISNLIKKWSLKNKKIETIIKYIYYVFIIALLLVSITYINADTYNPFIYFRF